MADHSTFTVREVKETSVSMTEAPAPIFRKLTDRKVRVLFVNTRSQIGADVAVHVTLIQNFPADEVEVHLVTNRNAVDLDKMRALMAELPHVRVQVVDLGNEMSIGQKNRIGKALSGLKNIGALLSVLRLSLYCRRHRIDVLHSTDRPRDALFSTLLARLSGCPFLLHLHIMWYPEIGRWTNLALKQCSGVLAISQFTQRSLIDGGVPENKIHTVLNAINPARFDPAKITPGLLRREWGVGKNTLLIGIVARMIVWKGHLELIEALAKVKTVFPDARLVIVGANASNTVEGSPYEESLKRRICELDLTANVIWTGWHENMPAVMSDLDVLAVPSWEEPFGLVVTEAMAVGRPVVGYRSGGLPEIITEGVEGLLVPPKDITALADALITLLGDPQLRAEMGRRGRRRVLQQFNPQRQCAEVAEVYRKIGLRRESKGVNL
ncbi:MAG: glycosyltransferase family 1 protein [Chthonomonadaceae bacterium]|nr:glycosyltransferase family 1 protein [Chthonomonadaceae bacterium]